MNLDPEVYRLAAECIHEEIMCGACTAIAQAVRWLGLEDTREEHVAFAEALCKGRTDYVYWAEYDTGDDGRVLRMATSHAIERRILILLLCAEVLETSPEEISAILNPPDVLQ